MRRAPSEGEGGPVATDGTSNRNWARRARRAALGSLVALVLGLPAVSAEHGSGGTVSTGIRCSADNRQTFDPASPPCIPFYEGDNGGATAPGVTATEVRVLVYLDGGINVNHTDGRSNELLPTDELYDLFKTPWENAAANGRDPDRPEVSPVKLLRAYQAYFNQRYQTYGRRLHFFVYFNDVSDSGPEGVQADVEALGRAVDPFAVIESADEHDREAFTTAWTAMGRLVFGNHPANQAASARQTPGLVWNHQASDEVQARLFSDYVCQQVVGAPGPSGPRRLGLVRSSSEPGLASLGQHVKARIEACGGAFVDEEVTPEHDFVFAPVSDEPRPEAVAAMARFRLAGVNAVVGSGGFDPEMSRAASLLGYRPEWLLAGDGKTETTFAGLQQGAVSFDGAHLLSAHLTPTPLDGQPCAIAAREIWSSVPRQDLALWCDFYVETRQAVIGIQVAGPTLSAASLDTGMHAMPPYEPTGPEPACWYADGDYTCMKDVAAGQWDPTGVRAIGWQPGCWRLSEAGKRYATSFPGPPSNSLARPRDAACSQYETSNRFNLT